MRWTSSVVLRIWFPVSLVAVAVAVTTAYLLAGREYRLLGRAQERELSVINDLIALQLERRSFEADASHDPSVTARIDSMAGRSGIILICYRQDAVGKPVVWYRFPAAVDPDRVLSDDAGDYFHADRTLSKVGAVRQNYSGSRIHAARAVSDLRGALDEQIAPVLTTALIVAFSALVLMYLLAWWYGRSLLEVNRFTAALLAQDYSVKLDFRFGLREMGQLRDVLHRLRIMLDKQRSRNQELTSGLEFQVAKRTQELKTVLERLHLAQRIGRIGNFQYWVDSDTMDISANMRELLGLDRTPVTTLKGLLDWMDPVYRDPVEDRMRKAIAGRSRLEIDIPFVHPKGRQTLWTSLIGDFGIDGGSGSWCLSGTFQDITERRKIEDQVSRLSMVAKLTTNGVIITDPDQRIVWVNEGMSRLSGYTFEEMIGRTPKMFQSERTSLEVRQEIADHLRSRKSVRVEVENMARDGASYWIELHIEPFSDAVGRLAGYLAVQVDVTERKRHEQELKAALEKANELNEIKSKFVSMASHEFRTPLTTIMSSAELLSHLMQSGGDLSREKLNRYIGRISGEVERLAGLINDVLVLGKQEAGKIVFRPVDSDLNALVNELFADRIVVAGDTRMLTIRFKGMGRPVRIDPALMGQVLTNLVTNGFKYSRGRPAPELIIAYEPDHIRIQVKDQGIGIPKGDQKHLFETFYRGRNVENIPGTGLGLAIVKQFVELHKGKITVDSAENSGTCVTLTMGYLDLESLS